MNNARVFIYEMGYTQQEFGNVLNSGFTDDESPYKCQSNSSNSWTVSHRQLPFKVRIEVTPLPERVLGAMTLPVLNVHFELIQCEDNQADAFFDKFFKYFHKGGG